MAGAGRVPGARPYGHALRRAVPSGDRTVCVARASAPWRWGDGLLEQKFSAEGWRGKRLLFSAAVRTEAQGFGTGARLFVQVEPQPPSDPTGAGKNAPTPAIEIGPPTRTSQWEACAVEIDVPDNAQAIVVGFVVHGNGTGWFGDIKLEAVGQAGGAGELVEAIT